MGLQDNKHVGVFGMSWELPVGLWDRQDTRSTSKTVGCPRDSLTIQWDLGYSPIGNRNGVGVSGHEWNESAPMGHTLKNHREGTLTKWNRPL